MSRKAWLVAAAAFGPMLAAVALLPLLFLSLPNPRPQRVASVMAFRTGVFVQAGEATYRLYQAPQPELLTKSELTVGPQARVLVRYRQLDRLSAYNLYRWTDGIPVSLKRRATDHLLVLEPAAPLPRGDYYAVLAGEGVYGGVNCVRFTVAGPTGDRSPSASPGR